MLKWRDMSLSGRLLWVSAVSVIPLIVFVSIGLLQRSRDEDLQRRVIHTYEVKASASDLLRLSVDQQTGARGYFLTRQAAYLEPLYSARSVFDRRVEELQKLVKDNPGQGARLEEIRQLSHELRQDRDHAIAQVQEGRIEEALQWVKSGEGKRKMDEIRTLSRAIEDEEDRLLAVRMDAAERWNRQIYWTSIVGGTGVVMFSILVSFIFAASLRRPLTQLQQGAKAIAAGQYDHRISVTTGAELGSLATAMNTMAEAIWSRDEELQAQNEELQAQQAELEAANVELETTQTELEATNERLSCSQSELNHFFTLSVDHFCLAGFDGYFKRLNPAWTATLGFTIEELLAKPFIEFVHPEDREQTASTAQQLSHGGEIVNFENRYLCKNGSYKWFLWSASSLPEEKLMYAVARDVTERKRLEQALRQKTDLVECERNQYQALMDSSSDGLAMADLRQNLLFMNEVFATSFGITNRSEFIAKPVEVARTIMLRRIKDPEASLGVLHKAWAEPTATDEALVELQDGTALRMKTGPVRHVNGQIIGRNITFSNFTKERAIDRMKSEFVATVSHELRTPLASLLGFSELLLHRELSPQKRKTFVETIHNEAVRLTGLINDFLDLQRIEAGRMEYDLRPLALPSLLRTVEAACAGQLSRHQLIIRHSQDLPMVVADSGPLQQVLQNLLSNAIKYSPEGGEILLTVEVLPDEHMVRLSVQDHGLGIPEEALPKLFEKFYRVDSSDHRKIGGTGLGLNLSREIVQAFGGTITVKSVLAKGSTFSFTLPMAEQEPDIWPEGSVIAESQIPDGTPYILVVEDDTNFTNLIQEHLTTAGYQTKIAPSAELAAAMIVQQAPLLILLDIHLAGQMDGWDLLLRVKQDIETWAIPIIVISVSENKRMGVALGVRDYLIKPFEMSRLLEAVRGVLGVGRAQRILVADDDPVFRLNIAESLRAGGFQVEQAKDGQDVLARLTESLPDLLIIDLKMPKLNGFQVLNRLRKWKETLKLPVLVVTGATLSQSEKKFIKERMAFLLPKSEYDPTKLLQMIKKTVSVRVVS